MILRTPNDPSWYKGGLWNDSMKINIPGLWMMTWYDISVAPNIAAYNHARKTADAEIANEQYAVIAPVPHCSYKGLRSTPWWGSATWAMRGWITTR